MSANPEPTKEIARADRGQIVQPQEWMRNANQIAVVRRDLAPGLDDKEFEVFVGICRSTGLNPVLRQIHAIRRNDKHSPTGYKICYQLGIDGYRLIAARSGAYAGNDEPEFYGDDTRPPVKCRMTVYRIVGGQRVPFTAVAYWAEYCPSGNQDMMWRKMPHTMLSKVAEALALRKAFPAELSGFYAEEELHQAEEWVEAETVQIQQPRRASESRPAPAQAQPAAREDSLEGQPAPSQNPPNFDDPNVGQITPVKAWCKERPQGSDIYWVKYMTAKGDEKAASTFSATIGEKLLAAYREKRSVWVDIRVHGKNLNVVNVWEEEWS